MTGHGIAGRLATAEQLDVVRGAIGLALRDARIRMKLTVPGLVDRMDASFTTQAILSYEKNQRNMTVSRYNELCIALRLHPAGLLAEMCGPAFAGHRIIEVDLRLLAHRDIPVLKPLRRWAQVRLIAQPNKNTIDIHTTHIRTLAEFCKTSPESMIAELTEISYRKSMKR